MYCRWQWSDCQSGNDRAGAHMRGLYCILEMDDGGKLEQDKKLHKEMDRIDKAPLINQRRLWQLTLPCMTFFCLLRFQYIYLLYILAILSWIALPWSNNVPNKNSAVSTVKQKGDWHQRTKITRGYILRGRVPWWGSFGRPVFHTLSLQLLHCCCFYSSWALIIHENLCPLSCLRAHSGVHRTRGQGRELLHYS